MIRRLTAQLVRLACTLAVAAVVLVTVAPAQAQMGMGGMGPGMTGVISRRSLDEFTKILMLDKDQKEVLTNLYEGYRKDHEAAVQKMQTDMRSLQEKFADTADIAAMQRDAVRFSKAFAEKNEQLEKAFMGDLKLALTDEQLTRWNRVEQHRRRDKHMRMAMVSGSAVDLTRVVERVRAVPADNAEFATTLERYEQDMDKHLLAYDRLQKEVEEKMYDTNANMMDMARWENIFKEYYPIAKDMRETNKEYARKLGMLMDEPSRARFEEEVRSRAFPRIYRKVPVLTMIENTEKLTELDAAKRAEVASIKESLLRELDGANERWAKAMEERDDKGGGALAVMMASIQGTRTDLNKDVNDARQARKELEARTKERLEALLTEEQRVKVTPPPQNDRGANPWFDMMPDDE
jgi:Spy/CpxP family protein refolding chaperone